MNNITALHEPPMPLDWFTKQRYSLHRHLFCWLLFALVFALSYQMSDYAEPYATDFKIGMSLSLFLLAYLNMYWLFPGYLLKNKFKWYVFLILSCLILSGIVVAIVNEWMRGMEQQLDGKLFFKPNPVMYGAFAFVFIAASTAIKLFQRWIEDTRRIHELTQSGMRAELEQLKNQINPHFLFNMLNNVNVLTQRDPEKASQVLMALSDLLRYQLYDAAQTAVFLSSDIKFLHDCLDLEQIRRDHFEYSITTNGAVNGIRIPPFLFSTFVENAIKHSAGFDQDSYIRIHFEVSEHRLQFTCKNSVPQPAPVAAGNSGGLGLVNIKRRLELLFGNKYLLNIDEEKDAYTVDLRIDL